jgi:WD40 repeat protein
MSPIKGTSASVRQFQGEWIGVATLLLLAASPAAVAAGDPLPAGALVRMGTSRFWHNTKVTALAFSADGKVLATGGDTRGEDSQVLIQLWEVATGRRLARWPTKQGNGLYQLVFSPDGKVLASAGHDNGVILWSVPDGKQLHHLQDQPDKGANGVRAVAFAPDGKTLATSAPGSGVTVWNVADGKRLHHWAVKVRSVDGLSFSPGGTRLAVTGFGEGVHVLNATNGEPLCRLAGMLAAFSADGLSLALVNPREFDGNGMEVCLFDSATGVRRGPAQVLPGELRALVRTSAGKILALGTSNDGPVHILDGGGRPHVWDALGGQEVVPLKGLPRIRGKMALSPDGKTLAVGEDAVVRLWSMATGAEIARSTAHRGAVFFLGLAADGKRLITAGGDSIRLWDLATGEESGRLDLHRPLAVRLSADGKLLARASSIDRSYHLGIWDLGSGEQVGDLDVGRTLADMLFLPDSRTLAYARGRASGHNEVRLWDTTRRTSRQIDTQTGISCLAVSPDGKQLAAGSGMTLTLWETATGKRLHQLTHDHSPEATQQVVYSPDGERLASWGDKHPIRIWDAHSGKEVCRIGGRNLYPRLLRLFSSDGRYLAAVGPENTLYLYDARSGEQFRRFPGPRRQTFRNRPSIWSDRDWSSNLCDVAFSADGKMLAAEQKDGSIRLWEVATGEERGRFAGHESGIRALAFLKGDRLLVSGGDDGTVLVWDTATARRQEKRTRP